MDTLILAIQIACVAGLAGGAALTMFQLAKPGQDTEGFNFALSDDFKSGARRFVRDRQ